MQPLDTEKDSNHTTTHLIFELADLENFVDPTPLYLPKT